MKKQHTPGPWYIDCDYDNRAFNILDNTYNITSVVFDEPNAKRIVDCVNAMEGIEDPKKFRDTRDELLEALQDIVKYHSDTETEFKGHKLGGTIPFLKAKAAIQKATE